MNVLLTLSQQDQGKTEANSISDAVSLPINGTDVSDERVSWKEKIEKDLEKERKAKQEQKQTPGNSLIFCIFSS